MSRRTQRMRRTQRRICYDRATVLSQYGYLKKHKQPFKHLQHVDEIEGACECVTETSKQILHQLTETGDNALKKREARPFRLFFFQTSFFRD